MVVHPVKCRYYHVQGLLKALAPHLQVSVFVPLYTPLLSQFLFGLSSKGGKKSRERKQYYLYENTQVKMTEANAKLRNIHAVVSLSLALSLCQKKSAGAVKP